MIRLKSAGIRINRIFSSKRHVLSPLFAVLIFLFGAAFAIKTLAQTSSTPIYFVGCLDSAKKTLYNVSFGTTPPPTPSCKSGDNPVDWANGDILSVIAGTGLTGGGLSGDVSLSMLPSFSLPQGCANGQVGKWNTSTSLWDCADDEKSVYTAGQGLNLIGNQFNLADLGVTSSKLVDGSVTASKLDSTAKTHTWSQTELSGSTNIQAPYVMSTLNVTVEVPSTILLIETGSYRSSTTYWTWFNIERDGVQIKGEGLGSSLLMDSFSDMVIDTVSPGTYVYTANISPTYSDQTVYWEHVSFAAIAFPN